MTYHAVCFLCANSFQLGSLTTSFNFRVLLTTFRTGLIGIKLGRSFISLWYVSETTEVSSGDGFQIDFGMLYTLVTFEFWGTSFRLLL